MKDIVRKFLSILIFCLPVVMGFYRGDCGFLKILFLRECSDPFQEHDFVASDLYHNYSYAYGTGNGRLYIETGPYYCDSLVLLEAIPGSPYIYDIDYDRAFIVACEGGIIARNSQDSLEFVYPNTGTTNDLHKIRYVRGSTFNYIVVGDSGTILRSNDLGYTWINIDIPSTANFRSIGGDRDKVTVTGSGNASFSSTDGGVTWTDDSLSSKLDNPELFAEMDTEGGGFELNAVQYVDSNLRYIAGENGIVFKTTNGGLNFNVRFVPGVGNITDLHFITADSGFVVTDIGRVRFTADGGTTWIRDTAVDNLFGGNRINEIMSFGEWGVISGDSNRLFLAARDSLSITDVDPISSNIPDNFTLLQNYPNPFNPLTIIRFNLPRAGNVLLKVYDVNGRLVTTLVNEMKTPGEYIVNFNGANLSSGVYFYSLQTENFTETKKMVLIK